MPNCMLSLYHLNAINKALLSALTLCLPWKASDHAAASIENYLTPGCNAKPLEVVACPRCCLRTLLHSPDLRKPADVDSQETSTTCQVVVQEAWSW